MTKLNTHSEQFTGRVEYVGDKEKNCTLRIRGLRKSDSGEYRFRFSTNTERGKFSGKPGVILNITDLQVRVSLTPVSEGQTLTLGCSSTCTLPYNPTYIWYKNGQPVTNKPTKHNKLYLEPADSEDGFQYSCVLGEESTALKQVTIGVAVCLALILITGALWIWRRKSRSVEEHRNSGDDGQCDTAHVYENIPTVAMTNLSRKASSDDQNDIHYLSLHFQHSQTQKGSSVSTTRLPTNSSEEECVQYAPVNFSRHKTSTTGFGSCSS
ncbi:sialic acid-binding Ig-like lectin 5 [Electrophorus electricus]|uniref:sialic acid-binding Ig-like lectin 5 n=1 Tax=Electrophorus electricus TaxID=8005 RepID=UPI0015CFD06E|nr:sialic acid-binding Ig-like lectin 5 [Electrophorus electricus]